MTHRRRTHLLVLLCAAGLMCGGRRALAAGGGPPYFTDDPVPVDYRHWEFYIASQYARAGDGATMTLPHFELNYGAAPNLQLHLITPFIRNVPTGGRTEYGYGDTELGVKYRFVQETAHRPQIATFPLIEAPTGDAARGLGSGHTQFFLPIWLQKSWGKWTSYGGGGYWRNPGAGNRDWWFSGIQAQYAVTKSLAIGAEVFHRTPDAIDTKDHTGFNIGAIDDLDDAHHLLFSIGRDFHGGDSLNSYFAYQWTF